MRSPYEEVAKYVHGVLDAGKPIDDGIPYWYLLAVVMDRRVADVLEDRASESLDTVEVDHATVDAASVTMWLKASTFVGRWYPVKLKLRRRSEESVIWFGAPDLSVDRVDQGRMEWPVDDAAWPAEYRFRLDMTW